MLIGHMKEIVRHPVKSLRGESAPSAKILDYGLYGDRSHAYFDETAGDFLTIAQWNDMVKYEAKFVGEESMDAYPKVEVVTPAGEALAWDDPRLIEEIESKSGRKISTKKYTPAHVPIGPIAVEHILLATDASLEHFQQLWGKESVDMRRFRPNLIVSLEEKKPFAEEEWSGRRIKIGAEVELECVGPAKRCVIITVDPDRAERDASLHKTLMQERNNHFGVYFSVVKTGEIRLGDEVHLLD